MSDLHEITGERGSDSWLFVCAECSRRLVLKDTGELVVLDQGDFFALHRGSNHPEALVVSATIGNTD